MFNYYKKSKERLKELLKIEDISEKKWNEYAEQNGLFTSESIKLILDVEKWEKAKELVLQEENCYIDFSKRSIYTTKIEKLRKKLDKAINKSGVDSKEAHNLSLLIDKEINEYYKKEKKYPDYSVMTEYFSDSYEQLIELTYDLAEFPSTKVWNYYAKKNYCLSNISIEYITGLNWSMLRDKVKTEINNKKEKKF